MNLGGRRVDGFEIVALAGEGRTGAVYKARQPALDRWVAIKVLAPEYAADREFLARFKREALSAARLNHENLVSVHLAGESEGLPYLVMEWVEGETVWDRVQRAGKLPPDEALAICGQVAGALEYAWQKAAMVHRDIKPGNIFLTQHGGVRLGGLGLAQPAGRSGPSPTPDGITAGSPYYISPEQARGDIDPDCRSDIYSLGCTLYFMVTGRRPYDGDDFAAVAHKHFAAPVPSLVKDWVACPPALAHLVTRMLLKQPAERFQNHEELRAEIQRVRTGLKHSAPAAVRPPPKRTGPSVLRVRSVPRHPVPVAARPQPRRTAAHVPALIVMAALASAAVLWWAPWKRPAATPPAGGAKVAAVAPATPAAKPAPAGTPVPPPAAPEKNAVNLLALVDPATHAKKGEWKLVNGALDSGDTKGSRIEIPCTLPEEYDLRIVFTRLTGSGGSMVSARLIRGGRPFSWILDGWGKPKNFGFAAAAYQFAKSPATMFRRGGLVNGRQYVTVVEVRKHVVRGYLDGEMLVEWKGDSGDVFGPRTRDSALGLSTWDRAVFHRIEVCAASAGSSTAPTQVVSTPGPRVEPDAYMKELAALPAEQQLARTIARLKELNPRFDGRVACTIQGNVVTGLSFSTVGVTDISPVAALKGLKQLAIAPTVQNAEGDLGDLSPLSGLPLVALWCHGNPIASLEPLKGMPLTLLSCGGTRVASLKPLAAMKLSVVACNDSLVADLAPLAGMPLTTLWCDRTRVADLSPLEGMPLTEIRCDFQKERDGEILASLTKLAKINDTPAFAFWARVGKPKVVERTKEHLGTAWEFVHMGKTLSLVISPDGKVRNPWAPAGQNWPFATCRAIDATHVEFMSTGNGSAMFVAKFNFRKGTFEITESNRNFPKGTTGKYIGQVK